MKKFLCLLTTMLLVLKSASSAFANPLFDKHWNQGEYVIELTDEEIEKYEKIFRTALEKSSLPPAAPATFPLPKKPP